MMTTNVSTLAKRPKEIVYPESDGQPIAENTLQFRWIVTIEGGLEAVFAADPDVFVAADLFWYPIEGQPGIRQAPDILTAFGRPKGDRPSYKQWLEGRIPPQVVWEILSPGNRPNEMIGKFQFYERHGVEEYYIYDPDNGTVFGWLRDGAVLREIPNMNGWASPRLGVRFEMIDGELRLFGPDGRPFATYMELIAQREQAHKEAERATMEKEQALQEKEQALQQVKQQAEAIEKLRAQLRAQGIDPNP